MLGIQGARKQLLPRLSKLLDPCLVLGSKLLLELSAQTLRESGTVSSSGDGDLEGAATNHCWIIEIAARGVIHDVAEHAAAPRLLPHPVVQFRGGCGDDDEKHAVKIGRFEFPRRPGNLSCTSPLSDLRRGLPSDDANHGTACEQALNLRFAHAARANDEARATLELDEHGKHRLHLTLNAVGRPAGGGVAGDSEHLFAGEELPHLGIAVPGNKLAQVLTLEAICLISPQQALDGRRDFSG